MGMFKGHRSSLKQSLSLRLVSYIYYFFVASVAYYNKICKITINVIGDLSRWSLQ